MEPVKEALERTAAALSSSLDLVFKDLEDIAGKVSRAADGATGVPRRKDFLFLKKELEELIERHSGLIGGAGIAYAPDSLPEAPRWLEWWRAQASGENRFVTHDLNPDSLNYYDYTSADWFNTPVASGQPIAVGPYVDFGGINTGIITLSVPAHTPQGNHVLGCDLPLAKLEGIFLRALRLREPSVILLGPNGRVIASNDARIASGTLLLDADAGRVESTCDIALGKPSRLPWTLVSLRP